MALMFQILMIFFFSFNFFSLSRVIEPCDHGEVCRHINREFIESTWCCPALKTCGENNGQCEPSPMLYIGNFVIILFIIITVVFICKCARKCFGGQDRENENSSTIIPQSTYQPISTTHSTIRIDEESPPSYEQVMNNYNLHRFEYQR